MIDGIERRTGFVAAVLAALAACSSGGPSGADQGQGAARAGSNGIAGAALAGTGGSQGGHNESGMAGISPASSGSGGAAGGAGGTNPIGGNGGSNAAGTAGSAFGGWSGAGGASASVGALETVAVPAGGAVTMSKVSLDSGALFLLKAVGALKAGTGADAQYGDLDAEYGGTAGGNGEDVVANVDVGIDVGLKVERSTAGRKKWFGSYRSDHTYYVIVTGSGAPLSLKTIQPASSSATGAINVSIFRLWPTPTPTPVMLDSLNAPLTTQTVHSNMTAAASTVYLLKVSGEGKVGGNALALGDADYMDYAQNGNGKVDVGDGNVDYGLGVDEFNTKMTPRQHWWGPWRQDHTYFMLFAGTGKPIGFMYYDIGYADNSTTAMLPVQILQLP